MKVKVEGKCNISATVVCDSVSPTGVRLTTFELEYPRIIHSELMTHRMFSRNAASSRAIPFEKMLQQLNGKPVRFGAANKGMQDKGEEHGVLVSSHSMNSSMGYANTPEEVWQDAKKIASWFAESYYKAGYHKQVYNRLLEPFQTMKTVVSATEWNNFFWLRDDGAADPTIRELAVCMKQVYQTSEPVLLCDGDYHLPYVTTLRGEDNFGGDQLFFTRPDCMWADQITIEQAIKVSAARCAAVSFRNEDYGLEKCLEVYERLVGDKRVHASALEHCATPIPEDNGGFAYNKEVPSSWPEGVTHQDREGNLWSGNFRGFIQHRQLIPNNVKK